MSDAAPPPPSSQVPAGRKPRVAVLFGGRSSEHAISCVTAGSVLAALDHEASTAGSAAATVAEIESHDPTPTPASQTVVEQVQTAGA